MAFSFEYVGGVKKPTEHTNEKFLLFFINNGKEVPLYQMQRMSLVEAIRSGTYMDSEYNKPISRMVVMSHFVTSSPYVKLFISQQGFGIQRRYHSFYLRLLDGPAPIVTIYPYSEAKFGMVLRAKMRFMETDEVLEMLDPQSESIRFLERQDTLPLDLLRRMVLVDKSELRKGMRAVRIQKR